MTSGGRTECSSAPYLRVHWFDSSQPFINLRYQLVQSQTSLEEWRKRSADLQTQVADMERLLIAARAQASAAEKGGAEAIDELKSTDKLISESLKAELDRLREEYSFVVSERDAQKSQLIEALLAKDKLRKEIEEGKELHETATATATAAAANLGPAEVVALEAAKKSGEKIEKLRTRLKERKQVSVSASGCDLGPLSRSSLGPFLVPAVGIDSNMAALYSNWSSRSRRSLICRIG